MTPRPWKWKAAVVVLGLGVATASPARSQQTGPTAGSGEADSPEFAIQRALAGHPLTAPYRLQVGRQGGKVVLAGRVGTKEIHDVAVRIAMAVTPSIDDRLVIDTAAAHAVAGVAAANAPAPASPWPYGAGGSATTYLPGPAGSPYLYPQPLFGRYDEPFYGFEPPLISYPPWWGGVAARRGDPWAAPVLNPAAPIGPDPGPPSSGAVMVPSNSVNAPGPAIPEGSIEMAIDPRGRAILRGTVPTTAARIAIGQKVERMEGVSEVLNLLNTKEDERPLYDPQSDVPPPPPTPDPPVNRAAPNAPRLLPTPPANAPSEQPTREAPAGAGTGDSLSKRVEDALARRPSLARSQIAVSVRDGVASLSGSVPTSLEAMAAFRAAQQTAGVTEVDDRLKFAVPDGQKPNPLVSQGRPEDVEPYLLAQIRRQVGDQAHVDRVSVAGDRLEIRGSLARDEDRPRIEAILRSMPLLRGYQLEARFLAD